MEAFVGSIIAIVIIVVLGNLFMVFRRFRNIKLSRTRKPAMDEQKAELIRSRAIQSRLEREQDEAKRRVELRNKTLELYEQVRRNAAARERGEPVPVVNRELKMRDCGSADSKIDDSLFIPFDDA